MHPRTLSFFTGRWNLKYSDFWVSTDAGFQVYQTHWVDYPQNDGFLDNLRIQPRRMDQGFGVHAELKTFTGYFRDGDWPRILRPKYRQKTLMERADRPCSGQKG